MSDECRETPDHTTHTDLPCCPHCGLEGTHGIPTYRKAQLTCRKCEKPFFVITETLYTTYEEMPEWY